MGKKKQRVVNPVWERKKNAIMRNYRKMVDPKVPKSSIDNEMDTTAEHLVSNIQEKKDHHDKIVLKINIPKRSVRISNRSKNVEKQENIIIAPEKFRRESVVSKEKNTIKNNSKSYLSKSETANTRNSIYRAKLAEDQKQAKREMDKQHYYEGKGFGVSSKSEKRKINQREGWREASKKYKMSQLLNNSSSINKTNISSQCCTKTSRVHSDQSFPIISRNCGDLSFFAGMSSLSIHREQAIKPVETIRNKSKCNLSMREKVNARNHKRRTKPTEDQKLAKGEINKRCYYEKKVCGLIKSKSCKSEKEKIYKRKQWREASRKYRERKSQLSNDSSSTYGTDFLTPCSSTTTISAHFDNSSDQFFSSGSISSRNSGASSFSTKSSTLSLRREQGIKRVKTINKNVHLQLEKHKRINEELKRKLDKYKRLILLKDSKIIELLTDCL